MDLFRSHWMYALILCVSLTGLVLIDRRWALVAFGKTPARKKATFMTLLITTGFFIIWDIAGILLGIFYTNTLYTLGINIFTPNLPIEEIIFLILLVYSVLIVGAGLDKYDSHYQHKKKKIDEKS